MKNLTTYARHILAVETDSDWLRAAEYALEGDDADLRWLIAREEQWEAYKEWSCKNPWLAERYDFDRWIESYCPLLLRDMAPTIGVQIAAAKRDMGAARWEQVSREFDA